MLSVGLRTLGKPSKAGMRIVGGRGLSKLLVRTALVWSLAGVALAVSALPASAVIVHLPSGKVLSYQPLRGKVAPLRAAKPFDAFFTNLDYSGGPVMPSNTNYTVYWQPSGAPAYPSGYQTGVNRYLEDLAHDSGGTANVDSVSAQYNDSAGEFANYESHFGGALIDTDPYPTSGCKRATVCLTDAQIQTELTSFVKAKGLPTDLTHEYFLLTPPGVESCFDAAGFECSAGVVGFPEGVYCAYHGNIPVAGGGQLIYSNDPYVTGIEGCDDGNHPNKSPSDGALEGGLTHEHNESITDPEPNNAWTDWGPEETGEIGDKCGGKTGEPLGETEGASYNQVINGHFYWYQEEWSNQTHQCLQRLSFSGERPTATFIVVSETTTKLRFDATGSTAPGGVKHYVWQFNEGGFQGSTVETTTPTIIRTLSTGTQTVALTAMAADGTSIGAARTFTVGGKGPTAAFTVGSSPTAGQPVSFNASSSSDPESPITEYAWKFGDGSTATGVSPTHTFATSGTYEVELAITDENGLSSSTTQSVVVAAASGGGGSGGGGGGTSPQPVEPIATTSSTPPPGQLAPLTATVSLAGAAVPVKANGQATLKLSCAGNASLCAGQVSITLKIPSGKGAHRRTRTLILASISFSIASGGSTSIKLHLSALALARLRGAKGHLGATLIIHKSSPAPALTQSPSIRLTLQKSTGSKARH